jgi:hypothetical protein
LAATLPLGATSESSPSSGFSVVKTTRKGAPFHGVTGEDRIASPTVSPQASDRTRAWAPPPEDRKAKNTPAISKDDVAAAGHWRAGNNGAPPLGRDSNIIANAWLNRGKFLARTAVQDIEGMEIR